MGATGRTHWRGLSWERGAAHHTWRYTATATQTQQRGSAGNRHLTSLLFNPPVMDLLAAPRTQWGAENGSGGAEGDHPAELSSPEAGSLGLVVTLCRHHTPHTHTQPFIPPFWFLCPFVHLGRERYNTSQLWFREVLSALCCDS